MKKQINQVFLSLQWIRKRKLLNLRLQSLGVRYSGAARRWFKKEQKKLGAEQAQRTSAPELGDRGAGDGSKAQGSKRPAPDYDIPSPQYRRPDKRSKLTATKMVRLSSQRATLIKN